jgi:GNAT superfamily N-acetyltransferase
LSESVRIRPAERSDVPLLRSMIAELAEYERAADQVTGTEAQLDSALFGPRAVAEAVVAQVHDADAGFAIYFHTFSTWLCQPGLYLEDLYVRPEHRGTGVGRSLLAHLAQIAIDRGCPRFEWSVLSWNAPAIAFYERVGAVHLDEWDEFRLAGEPLATLAREAQRVS